VRTTDDSIIYESTPGEPAVEDATVHRACLYCLWKKDYFHLEVHFPSQRDHALIQMSTWLFSSALFLLIFILSFYYTITTVIRQKKISQIRDDLLNNITHEFKTPISTISLASEVMIKNDNSEDSRIARYAKIIFDENKRMRTHVDRVLQMAALDRGEYSIEKAETNLDTLLINVVNNLCLEHCETIVDVKYNLIAENPVVSVDSIHLSNIVSNLVNNAIKYSNGKPVITISSKNENNSYVFSVEDQGIGIRKENFKQIFEKFYRVPTGNVHNVRGFGIGLYYVKTMIELHKGKIHVYSEPGKGTRFDISLPQEN
jgi:two-component system phosphate regulon sensor histidine kinase PhoR